MISHNLQGDEILYNFPKTYTISEVSLNIDNERLINQKPNTNHTNYSLPEKHFHFSASPVASAIPVQVVVGLCSGSLTGTVFLAINCGNRKTFWNHKSKNASC